MYSCSAHPPSMCPILHDGSCTCIFTDPGRRQAINAPSIIQAHWRRSEGWRTKAGSHRSLRMRLGKAGNWASRSSSDATRRGMLRCRPTGTSTYFAARLTPTASTMAATSTGSTHWNRPSPRPTTFWSKGYSNTAVWGFCRRAGCSWTRHSTMQEGWWRCAAGISF